MNPGQRYTLNTWACGLDTRTVANCARLYGPGHEVTLTRTVNDRIGIVRFSQWGLSAPVLLADLVPCQKQP